MKRAEVSPEEEPKKKCPRVTVKNPLDSLEEKAREFSLDMHSYEFAKKMDEEDSLRHLRDDFCVPKMKDIPSVDKTLVDNDEDCVYLSGNSLGLQPKKTRFYMDQELNKWGKYGVHGHFLGDIPWAFCDEVMQVDMSKLVGANPEEVAIMNGLTVNLHLLMVSFYRPTEKRHKILIESKAFPADHYAMESQICNKGYDPKSSLLCLKPSQGRHIITTEEILSFIEREGDEIALILMGGLQYFSGQLFDMEAITKAGHAKGCVVAFDLAHAVGNVELKLHDWGVDFAVWCNYKYVNGGAGALAGAFLHNKHKNNNYPKLLGWWGNRMSTRFHMSNELDLSPGIAGYRISNPSIMAAVPIRASLDVFNKTCMADLRAKSTLLTGYLEFLLNREFAKESEIRTQDVHLEIATPSDYRQRGAQLSLMFSVPMSDIHSHMMKRGIVCDERQPNVIRVAPAPLYNSFKDVWRFIKYLRESIEEASHEKPKRKNSDLDLD
ncbi:kynureninase-like isoform X2 [Apostichopus japonicus]|uniref:kynureninase-like isoform X2 n=1 Tax=Stichopus japonicus TaxID=307972 RepID=UPI003AB3DB05